MRTNATTEIGERLRIPTAWFAAILISTGGFAGAWSMHTFQISALGTSLNKTTSKLEMMEMRMETRTELLIRMEGRLQRIEEIVSKRQP